MSVFTEAAAAVGRAPETETRTLEEFLAPLLDKDLEQLAELPGTPGLVLAAQFLHYARRCGELTEVLRRNYTESDRVTELVRRLHTDRRKKREDAAPGDADSAEAEAAA